MRRPPLYTRRSGDDPCNAPNREPARPLQWNDQEDVMNRLRLVVAALLLSASTALFAQGTVKIAVIAEFSGPFADYGTQILNGMKTYLKLNGDVFGGKKIELITR